MKKIIFVIMLASLSFADIRFEGRAAFGGSVLSVAKSDANMEFDSKLGVSFTLGAGAAVPISSTAFFKPSFHFLYRTYGLHAEQSYAGMFFELDEDIQEFVLGISALFRSMLTSKLYQDLGIQFDMPISCRARIEFTNDTDSDRNDDVDGVCGREREMFDAGLAFGLGYFVSDHVSLGGWGLVGLTNAFKNDDSKIYQFGLGLNYLF